MNAALVGQYALVVVLLLSSAALLIVGAIEAGRLIAGIVRITEHLGKGSLYIFLALTAAAWAVSLAGPEAVRAFLVNHANRTLPLFEGLMDMPSPVPRPASLRCYILGLC